MIKIFLVVGVLNVNLPEDFQFLVSEVPNIAECKTQKDKIKSLELNNTLVYAECITMGGQDA